MLTQPYTLLWKTCRLTILQQLPYTHTCFLPRSTGIEKTTGLIQALVSIVLSRVSHIAGCVWLNTHRIPVNTACIPSGCVCMYIHTYIRTYVYLCVCVHITLFHVGVYIYTYVCRYEGGRCVCVVFPHMCVCNHLDVFALIRACVH